MKISIVIPCYNEEKNILDLKKKFKVYKNKKNYELILIDNGSIDKTYNLLIKKFSKIKNFKIIKIKKNKGFGFAIKLGIKKSSGNFIAYTHADQETSQDDIYKFFKNYKGSFKNIFVKGFRTGRSKIDKMFTFLMSITVLFFFQKFLNDIHAQPNIFEKKLINNISDLPDDFSIDTAIYLKALKSRKEIKRINVKFGKRKYGLGNNIKLQSKIKNSFINFFSIIKLFVIF